MNCQVPVVATEIQTIPWDTIITNAVVIIGFIVSVVMTRRNIKAETEKLKTSIAIEALQDALLKIFSFLSDSKMAKTDEEKEAITWEMMKAVQKVVAYGSKDAVVIAASFQENNYAGAPDSFRTLAYYAILAAQLKYDITGEVIAPELFFKFYLTDYAKNEAGIKNAIDELVEELKLNDRLKSSL
ncbi:MAG: hypothetical protein E7335_06540 [Clostridiales bacterium]|nr:hypothetical protein [Clostridiales bacterium]